MKRFWGVRPLELQEGCLRRAGRDQKAGAQVVEVDFPSVEERQRPDGRWDWEYGSPSTVKPR